MDVVGVIRGQLFWLQPSRSVTFCGYFRVTKLLSAGEEPVEPNRDRGVALILALLVLSFLGVLGGALLSTSTIDIWISDNYKSATQSLYLAEAGIERGREVLGGSASTPSELLAAAAGQDHLITTSTDLAMLLASDDQPLIPSQPLIDSSGRIAGYYSVWLRNDNVDGIGALTDSNEVLSFVSIAQVGSARKTIEATIEKGKFPDDPGDPRLKTINGLESLVAGITRNAADVYNPPRGARQTIGNHGDPISYKVTVVNGDVDLGPGTGYGILLACGDVNVTGAFAWNGLILVIGQGVMHWDSSVRGTINGGLFLARTRAPDGTLLGEPADAAFDITDPGQIRAANRLFPYNAIAIRER